MAAVADIRPAVEMRRDSEAESRRAFFGVLALLFAGSAAVTITWCASMADMGEIPMPGSWMLSMAWMPMCEQGWLGATVSFIGMWIVMMVAMMLPSLTPMLWRYRQAVGMTGGRADRLTAVVGLGYFFIWTLIGIVVFATGAVLAEALQQLPAMARTIPVVGGAIVLLAGTLQFSSWKARHLACCRAAPAGSLPANVGVAWRYGLRLGLHCSYACAGLTAILLVLGVMDLRAMAVVIVAITAERLAPAGERVARILGALIVGAGVFLIVRAASLG